MRGNGISRGMGIAVAGVLVAVAGTISEPAKAQTACCWINAKTGEPYPADRLVPLGMTTLDFRSDPNHFKVPHVRGAPLSEFKLG